MEHNYIYCRDECEYYPCDKCHKLMICKPFAEGLCSATICDRQKPHPYNPNCCTVKCESIDNFHCIEYKNNTQQNRLIEKEMVELKKY